MTKEENIKEAINIIKDVRRTMPECTNKAFLQGALNELDKALQSENERLKAHNVRKFMLKKYPTNKYIDCPVPQHHWPVIQEYAEQYARIQIEKDRDYAAPKASEFGIGYNQIKIEQAIKNRPINLD